MTITSPSFPNGLPPLRNESEVRAARGLSILPAALSCPFCGTDPELATRSFGYFQVGCTAEECAVNPQTSDTDLSKAWAKWNGRRT
jgi:hypothetical protein